MHTKLFMGLAMAVVLSMLACGGGSSYSDAIEVNQDFVDAMESYIDGVEKAESGPAMAKAINGYADKMEELAPRMKAIAQKYPEWTDPDKIPEAIKPLTEKAASVAKRMAGSFMKAMQYMQDADVQAAQQRLAQSMNMMK